MTGRSGSTDTDDLIVAIDTLGERAHEVKVLFLDAPDDVLLRRFEGSRRRHPRTGTGVEEAIAAERRALESLKARADVIIDTGDINSNQLRNRIFELFNDTSSTMTMKTTVMSFGFKHGIPLDVDMVLDVRFLPNPHWVEELRELTGINEQVRLFVLSQAEASVFLEKIVDLLQMLLPSYMQEGKSYFTLGVGCTGGHHRSVVLAEELGQRLRDLGFPLSTFHRDIER